MALKIKDPLKQLQVKRHGIVWTSDTAVDLEASDLNAWADSLGTEGLVFKDGEKADVIQLRPLTPDELGRALRETDQVQISIAAKYGVLSVPGLPLRRDASDFLGGLTRESVNMLMLPQLMGPIPLFRLIDQMAIARGDEPQEHGQEMRDAIVPTELGYALGTIVLALSFRQRRDHA